MSKNCIGKLYIGELTDNSLQNIELSEDALTDINLVVDKLLSDKDALSIILNLLDRVNYRKPVKTSISGVLGQYDFKKGIPVGIYSMKSVISSLNNIPLFMLDAIELSGFDMESTNITLDNSMVALDSLGRRLSVVKIQNIEHKRTDSKGTEIIEQQERVILPNSREALLNYVKYRYLMTFLNHPQLKAIVNQLVMSDITDLIAKGFTKKIFNNLKKADENSRVLGFLQMYYSDSIFNDVANSLTGYNIEKLLHAFMYNRDSDVSISELGTFEKGIIKLKDIRKNLKKQGLDVADPILYVREKVYNHNLKNTQSGKYILLYEGNDTMKLIPSMYLESLRQTKVSTRFYSPVIPVEEKYMGHYIYKLGNDYYTSKFLVDNITSFKELVASKRASKHGSLSFAKTSILKNFESGEVYAEGGFEARLLKSDNKIINHKNAPVFRSIIEVPDITLAKGDKRVSFNHRLVFQKGITYKALIKGIKKYRDSFFIPIEYDLDEVFTSDYNVDIFLHLANILWLEAEDKGTDISERMKELLDNIRDASLIAYRVGESNGTSYLYERVEELVNVSQEIVKPFRNDLIYTIEQLEKLFGIKIHKITSDEVMKGKYKNIPNILTAKAFILNGEIYVNVDKAHNKDLMHEYGHLILAMLKNKDIDTYMKILDTVKNHPDYTKKVNDYRKKSDKRALYDILEEIIVDLFGDHLGRGMQLLFSHDVHKGYLDAMRNVFGFSEDISIYNVGDVNQLTLEDAIKLMGSTLLSENNPFSEEAVKETIVPRKIANIIGKMMDNGELIESNC